MWPCRFRLERSVALAGYVAWLDVCPVIWVALLDSSHGRFWIVPGFGSSLNVDLRWFWVFTDFGSPLDLGLRWIWVSAGFGSPLDLVRRWIWIAAGFGSAGFGSPLDLGRR